MLFPLWRRLWLNLLSLHHETLVTNLKYEAYHLRFATSRGCECYSGCPGRGRFGDVGKTGYRNRLPLQLPENSFFGKPHSLVGDHCKIKRPSFAHHLLLISIKYYPASAQSNGEVPPSEDLCTVSASSYATWEGQSHACKFPTGVTFTSHIEAGSHSFPNYSGYAFFSCSLCLYANQRARRTGNNGKNWKCYRDNGRGLFTTSGPEWSRTCSSVYYCLPA